MPPAVPPGCAFDGGVPARDMEWGSGGVVEVGRRTLGVPDGGSEG